MNTPYWFNDFIDLFYPDSCLGCQAPLVSNESTLCLQCLNELPQTQFHLLKNNAVEQVFIGRCHLQKATSFLYFSKGGIVQSMMHALKYKGRKEVAELLGSLAAQKLLKDGFFDDIDILAPIPLHPKKLALRGFNQSQLIASSMGAVSNIPVSDDNLIRTTHTDSQTKKARFARWLNVESVFELKEPQLLYNKHVLLIDDVITTGATVEACVTKLQSLPHIKVSLFTLGVAK